MSESVNVTQMNNIFLNLQVEEGTFYQDINSQNGRLKEVNQIYVELIEEPLTDRYRFRYENEGRAAGRIKGVKTTHGHTTYPTDIQQQHSLSFIFPFCFCTQCTANEIHGYQGPVYIYVSLITIHGPPYYPHPHKLVGEDCKDGVFRKLIDVTELPYCFTDLRIQCVKKKQVDESLKERERRRIDPFGTGFSHSSDLNKINFNAVRLCFQVLLPGPNDDFYDPVLLSPVISKPIYDSKSASNMAIMKLSHCSASVKGKEEIILLCGHVNKDDIEIIFYEEKDNEIIWTGYGEFSPHDVHHKVAISFKTPAYKTQNVRGKIKCFLYLRRISDGTIGRPREFTLLPIKKESNAIDAKRPKYHDSPAGRDCKSNNICSAKPDDINSRVKKETFEIRRNYGKAACNTKTVQSVIRKDAAHKNVENTPKAIEKTLKKEVTYPNGTVSHLRCNLGDTSNLLPSVSVLGNDSCVQNGTLLCHIPENQASATSLDPLQGVHTLDISPNTQQLLDNVYPADSENIELKKGTAFEDCTENDKLKIPSKDVDPNQNSSNENESSISLDTDEVINGFNTIFEFINADNADEKMSFENNMGVLRKCCDEDATDHDSADDCLNRLSSLSLEPNSKDQDVTMKDVAQHSFSEAVEISISVSS